MLRMLFWLKTWILTLVASSHFFVMDGLWLKCSWPESLSMVFPPDHPEYPYKQKGVKFVLQEQGLWKQSMHLKFTAKEGCDDNATNCCASQTHTLQPDFLEQKSRVQGVIEVVGHLCIFLPKFHCELNLFEYFWGAVKWYLHEHCDYTFQGLQDNLPKAVDSISLQTIWKWEHWMIWWMDPYREGKDSKEAMLQVKKYSSCQYTLHHRVFETVAQTFDNYI